MAVMATAEDIRTLHNLSQEMEGVNGRRNTDNSSRVHQK